MNAKKIMGAVLVALLAAALFVGAGAAATDIGTVTTYTELTSPFAAGQTFYATDGTAVTVVNFGALYFAADESQLNKKYTGHDLTFKLVAPTAVVAALDENGVNIIGQTVSASVANDATFTYTFNGAAGTAFIFIDADGVKYNAEPTNGFTAGKWGVAANLTAAPGLVSGAAIQGQTYYFTVAKTDATISAAKDTVNVGNSIVLNVVVPGEPHVKVYYDKDYVTPIDGQYGVIQKTDEYVNVTLGIDGAASVAFKAAEEGKTTFELTDLTGKPKVDVTIEKGEITAVADEEFFYLGNAIKLSGTTTAGDELYFYIEGTNFKFQNLSGAYYTTDLEVGNGEWTIKIDSNKVKTPVSGQTKGLVTGTYTIIVSTVPYTDVEAAADKKAEAMSEVYGTVAVTMKQPFITDVKAAAVAIQDNTYDITGTAIAAADVNVYIFGTSFFLAKQLVTVDSDDETFKITLDEATTKSMAPGTYFYLIQHPMNDKKFNVWNGSVSGDKYVLPVSGAKEADFFYAATGATGDANFIFNAWDRGTNFAAQALLNEISGQNIDDIFVQGTFEVAAQKLTINPIPAEVVKGTALTVSGTSNSGEGVEVIVNVLAGKFGATVKGDENAATFLTAKAVTQEDGTFEAKIDTSKLETGNYIVTVELEGTMYDSAAVEIVAAADEPVNPEQPEEPEQPEQPEQPEAPATPGFGALAALAGLGAVAVLLLRRE